MVAEWIIVNGARIERSFLEANVAEARSCVWQKTRWATADDHGHCMICSIALGDTDPCYRSKGGWLDEYCFGRFIQREG